MENNLFLWLEQTKRGYLWFFAILISVLFSGTITTVTAAILKGELSINYLLTAFVVAGFVLALVYYFVECLLLIRDNNAYLAAIISKQNGLVESFLWDSDKAYQSILATTLDGFWMINSQGKLLDVNSRYAAQSGYSRKELLNMFVSDLEAIESTHDIVDHIQQIIKNGGDQFSTMHRRKNGTFWHVEISATYFNFNGGRFYVFLRDIDERKKIEAQREQFFKFFILAPDFKCIAGLDGFFKHINPVFPETLGFSTNELLQTPFLEFVLPEDREKTRHEIEKLQDSGAILEFENRFLCKDGSFCWLAWKAVFDPADQQIYAVARNVTECKKIEEKLQLAEMVYQNSIEAMLVTDANNQIIAVNPAFTKITGYSLEEIAGKNPRIFKSDRHTPEFYQAMWQDINSKGQWQGEIWDKRKNGDIHAKSLSINTVFNKNGQIHHYLALFSDITAHKQYQDEIKRLSDSELNKAKLEAEKANRAKSDFLSSMSHELRTPMNAVLGFAQLLESEDLTEDQQDSVKEILTAGHHLMDLINQVLDLSKIESERLELNLEKINLSTVVGNCLVLVQPLTVKNKIKIFNDTADCDCTVVADLLHLKQVLLNLISNAIKYNQVNGSIRVSCEVINAQIIRVNVADTGHGLSELQLSKLFQPFERLSAKNSNIEGTGIGLCISKKLIEAMNGAIGVSSTVGVGSCFWIEVPLAESGIF